MTKILYIPESRYLEFPRIDGKGWDSSLDIDTTAAAITNFYNFIQLDKPGNEVAWKVYNKLPCYHQLGISNFEVVYD